MLKLITDSGNEGALKACIVASAHDLTSSEPRENIVSRMPVLVVNSECSISEGNAIALYLASVKTKTDCDLGNVGLSIASIIEWESRVLGPVARKWFVALSLNGDASLLPPSAHGRIDLTVEEMQAAEKSMRDSLKSFIEPRVETGYLVGDSVTLADVIVWCRIHHFIDHIRPDFPTISRWYDTIAALSWVSAGVGMVDMDNAGPSAVWSAVKQAELSKKLAKGSKSIKSQKVKPKKKETKKEKAPIVAAVKSAPKHSMRIDQTIDFCRKPPRTDTAPSSRAPPMPVKGQRNILITSALPYVNNVPHLGNIIGCVLSGDVYARLMGYNTVYVSGTDEYGTATVKRAIEEGVTPQQICDKYFELHREVYEWFDIDFDLFGRTCTDKQTEIVQDIFRKLDAHGLISEEEHVQLFCSSCTLFLADRFVEGTCPKCAAEDARGDQCDKCGNLLDPMELITPKCVVCSSTPAPEPTTHLFFDLSLLEKRIENLVENADGWTQNAICIAKSWLHMGLKQRSITRDLKWGTPVPADRLENKVFYVWFEATLGYISITANLMDRWGLDWRKWWMNREDVELTQFMGKDNVPFHAIIFPATQFGCEPETQYTMVNRMSVTEYLNYEDTKFSKSRGIGVFGDAAKTTGIPSEVFRFYLLSRRPEQNDSAFSWADLQARNNNELLANLGNFINRVLKFMHDKFDGLVPQHGNLNTRDDTLISEVNTELTAYINALEEQKLRDGAGHVLKVSAAGNLYLQDSKPWALMKGTEDDIKRAWHVLWLCGCVVKTLLPLIEPYMPTLVEKVLEMLPIGHQMIPKTMYLDLKVGQKLVNPGPLVRPLEDDEINRLREKFAGAQ